MDLLVKILPNLKYQQFLAHEDTLQILDNHIDEFFDTMFISQADSSPNVSLFEQFKVYKINPGKPNVSQRKYGLSQVYI